MKDIYMITYIEERDNGLDFYTNGKFLGFCKTDLQAENLMTAYGISKDVDIAFAPSAEVGVPNFAISMFKRAFAAIDQNRILSD